MTNEGSTNVSLIERVRVHDSQAWTQLVDLYGPLIAYWCRRSGVPERSMGDCVQNVFVAVLRSLVNFRFDAGRKSFRAWLWGITRHKCIDMLRSDGLHPSAVGGSTALKQIEQWTDNEWSEFTEPLEISRLVERALEQVKTEFEEKTWRAFWRTTVDGIATPLVAKELDITSAAVRQYRSRVLRRLRNQLGEFE